MVDAKEVNRGVQLVRIQVAVGFVERVVDGRLTVQLRARFRDHRRGLRRRRRHTLYLRRRGRAGCRGSAAAATAATTGTRKVVRAAGHYEAGRRLIHLSGHGRRDRCKGGLLAAAPELKDVQQNDQ